tara:strand:+ start:148 stop:357 length:210 start_codon:yes stop_codon:yes gene_type:complete
MSLKTIKEEVRFLTNDVTVLEKVVLEKRAVLNRAIATMQSRCKHPESSIVVYRSYGEKNRECVDCGKEW